MRICHSARPFAQVQQMKKYMLAGEPDAAQSGALFMTHLSVSA